MTLENVVAALSAKREGNKWKAICPAHTDHSPSLDIERGDKQPVVFKCWAGCTQAAVLAAVQKKIANRNASPASAIQTEVAPVAGDWGYSQKRLEESQEGLEAAEEFLRSRGITFEAARKLGFGFENEYLVMPTFVNGELAAVKLRALGEVSRDQKWRKYKRDDKTYWLFNRNAALDASFGDDLYITESELDAAMLESMGIRAVSFDSAGHKLTDADVAILKGFPGSLVFAGDTDQPGINCSMRAVAELGLEFAFGVRPPTKDLGELYAQDPAGFPEKLIALRAAAAPVWQTSFRSIAQLQQGEVRLLIDRILPEGNTFTGACAGVGKTWFQLSMAKALVTGEPFLGVFHVPERQKVLYLIPEAGDRSFRKRCERMGIPIDGSVFLCRTLVDGVLKLDDPALEMAIKAWKPVIFLDTAIRFAGFKDENSSAENATGLADSIFNLLRLGTPAVVSAHHSPKSSANVSNKNKYISEPSLENMLRGTGDIGAMCDTVWALRHDDGGKDTPPNYLEESKDLTRLYVSCVKPRDFEPAEPFVIQGKPYIDERGDFIVLTEQDAPVENVAGRALQIIGANPTTSKSKLGKTLGVHRHKLDEILASVGWRYRETSKTTGIWERLAAEYASTENQ
jgi:hypothetical protein